MSTLRLVFVLADKKITDNYKVELVLRLFEADPKRIDELLAFGDVNDEWDHILQRALVEYRNK
jgi:hypothetical protein